MSKEVDEDWLRGRASLGAASGWTPEEMRLVADLGFALAEQGRDDEALEIFAGLSALAPATAYFQGAYHEALEHLNAALRSDPTDVVALTNRGEVQMILGDQTAAVRDLRAALDMNAASQRDSAADIYVVRARALLDSMRKA